MSGDVDAARRHLAERMEREASAHSGRMYSRYSTLMTIAEARTIAAALVVPRCATCRWAVERLHDGEELPLLCTRVDADGALIETNDGSYPSVAPDFGCLQYEPKGTT